EYDRPRERLSDGVEVSAGEQDARREQEYTRERVGRRNHDSPPPAIELPTEQQRAGEVSDGEGHDVQPDVCGRDAMELLEDQAVAEEDRVVEEGLGEHQREAEDRALGIA